MAKHYKPPCFQIESTSRRHMYVPQMSPAMPRMGTPPNLGGRPAKTRMLEQIKTDAVRMALVSRFAIESSVLRSGFESFRINLMLQGDIDLASLLRSANPYFQRMLTISRQRGRCEANSTALLIWFKITLSRPVS